MPRSRRAAPSPSLGQRLSTWQNLLGAVVGALIATLGTVLTAVFLTGDGTTAVPAAPAPPAAAAPSTPPVGPAAALQASTPPGDLPAAFVGTYAGTYTAEDGGAFPVQVDLRGGAVGSAVGGLVLPGACGPVELVLLSAGTDALRLRERVVSGRCQGEDVEVSAQADGSLRYRSLDSAATAELRRR